jgi:hypothetical protein
VKIDAHLTKNSDSGNCQTIFAALVWTRYLLSKMAFIFVINTKLPYIINSVNPLEVIHPTIQLPLIPSGRYDFIVKWGDGSSQRITNENMDDAWHCYEFNGEYSITIRGTLEGWSFREAIAQKQPAELFWAGKEHLPWHCAPRTIKRYTDLAKMIVEVKQWGCLSLTDKRGHFEGCQYMCITDRYGIWLNNTMDRDNGIPFPRSRVSLPIPAACDRVFPIEY